MSAYWEAVKKHIGNAASDVLFVAAISLAPLLLGRIGPFIGTAPEGYKYWEFIWNGQMAFFSMSSIAALILISQRKSIHPSGAWIITVFSIFAFGFVMLLIGADPNLQAKSGWIGFAAFGLYIAVLLVRILAEAMKAVPANEALEAGAKASKKTEAGLRARMSGGRR